MATLPSLYCFLGEPPFSPTLFRYYGDTEEEVAWMVPSRPFTLTVLVGADTFFNFSAAVPERIASIIASLARAGSATLPPDPCPVLGLGCADGGGGGGGSMEGGGGGGGVKAGGERKDGDRGGEGDRPFSSEDFLIFSSSPAASDLVCRNLGVVLCARIAASRADLSFSSSTYALFFTAEPRLDAGTFLRLSLPPAVWMASIKEL